MRDDATVCEGGDRVARAAINGADEAAIGIERREVWGKTDAP